MDTKTRELAYLGKSDENFYTYYAAASQSPETFRRIASIRDCVLRLIDEQRLKAGDLEIGDIGCGAGTQSIMWADLGHHVHGLDVNEPLLQLATERAVEAGYIIDFRLGSATALPWADESMDVCLLLELLEHVPEWQDCLDECARVLRPNGILVLTTTNWLCPAQDEFALPLYSWYPAPLKLYFEHLSISTRPDLVNYAKYPAVNWFSFYSLRRELTKRGFKSLDRFDVMDRSKLSIAKKLLASCLWHVPPLRLLGYIVTRGTMAIGVKSRI